MDSILEKPFEHLTAFLTNSLYLKIIFAQDPDQKARASEGGPWVAQEPPQHDAPVRVQQAGHDAPVRVQAGHATLRA